MEEFRNIKWRKYLLRGVDVHIEDEHMQNSHINNLTINGLEKFNEFKEDLDEFESDSEELSIPGARHYFNSTKRSSFDIYEHDRLICALKAIRSGVKKRDYVLRGDIEFYNNVKQKILEENAVFLKNAECVYYKFVGKKPIKINADVYHYAKMDRLNKLKSVFKLPQYYKDADLFSYSYSDEEAPIEMVHTENVYDLGTVSKFRKPLETYPHTYDLNTLPDMNHNNYNSKQPVSQDANIESIITSRDVDIVLSISSIKKLINFTEINQTWHMPVVVKEVKTVVNGKVFMKKVVLIDKPLPKLLVTKVNLLERCCKLFVKTNFCQDEGFVYPNQEQPLSEPTEINEPMSKNTDCDKSKVEQSENNDTKDEDFVNIANEFNPFNNNKINHNVAYKMWRIEPKIENISMKHSMPNQGLNVLIRNKIDACEKLQDGTLQPLTVVPKIEYQLCYGGQICTKTELSNQWASLFFKPQSNLYRIRQHYYVLEVVQAECCNIVQVNNEAMQYHKFKPYLGLGVMYKIFSGLRTLPVGNYLLNHDPKHGPFVVVKKEHNDPVNFPSCFNLHRTYGLEAKIIDTYLQPWIPIDVNVLLPIFEHNFHMPGMFPPKNPAPKVPFKSKKGKKNKKKKGGQQGNRIVKAIASTSKNK